MAEHRPRTTANLPCGFQLNTNIDGKRKIMYALTEIKGVGRRYANVVCKKADVDLGKRCRLIHIQTKMYFPS